VKKTLKPNQKNPESKKKQIINLFNSISPNYDSLNRIMTFGIDMVWRKRVVRLVQKQKHNSILDIATGTGDLALSLAKLNSNTIIGLDISKEMLSIGKQKVLSRNLNHRIKMLSGDSEDLNFDIVTISFGIRNLENIEKGLNEIKRVLKSKGALVILETSVPKNIIVKSLYLLYVRNIIPLISFILSNNRFAYQYLSDSAIAFPCGESFNNILRKNGFIEVDDFPQTFGVSSIYFAKKP
jgi:demethylmenaquinone methyltransferase/2-methoxy-6-polyprenyl-1,4-benzoquinol methylase